MLPGVARGLGDSLMPQHQQDNVGKGLQVGKGQKQINDLMVVLCSSAAGQGGAKIESAYYNYYYYDIARQSEHSSSQRLQV